VHHRNCRRGTEQVIPACPLGTKPVAPCGTLLSGPKPGAEALTPNRRLVSDGAVNGSKLNIDNPSS